MLFTINTIEDLNECINEIKKNIPKNIAYPTLWYRGQPNSNWPVVPSIQRNKAFVSEQVICHAFYHRASQIIVDKIPKDEYSSWISLMQHYGLPTRLLDWSYSPLIALYFAVEENERHEKKDACISVIIPEQLNLYQGFDPYIYPLDSSHALSLLRPAFYKSNMVSDKMLACFSVGNDIRMYAQRSAFTVHDTSKTIKEILGNENMHQICIPSQNKEYFRNVLIGFGITEEYIFPDLTHISKQIMKNRVINKHKGDNNGK